MVISKDFVDNKTVIAYFTKCLITKAKELSGYCCTFKSNRHNKVNISSKDVLLKPGEKACDSFKSFIPSYLTFHGLLMVFL